MQWGLDGINFEYPDSTQQLQSWQQDYVYTPPSPEICQLNSNEHEKGNLKQSSCTLPLKKSLHWIKSFNLDKHGQKNPQTEVNVRAIRPNPALILDSTS